MTLMIGLVLSASAVLATAGTGYLMAKRGYRGSRKMFVGITAASFGLLLTGALLTLLRSPASAADAAAAAPAASAAAASGLGFIGMALATGLACIGAGVAVGSVGSAALGLVGEKPEMLGITLLYVGLAEGVAIYGIVISMLVYTKLG